VLLIFFVVGNVLTPLKAPQIIAQIYGIEENCFGGSLGAARKKSKALEIGSWQIFADHDDDLPRSEIHDGRYVEGGRPEDREAPTCCVCASWSERSIEIWRTGRELRSAWWIVELPKDIKHK
jgi:hypothetical protein